MSEPTERRQKLRAQAQRIDALIEELSAMETRAYLAEECLAATLELLREKDEQLAFERDVTAGLLLEIPATPRLKLAA